MHREQEALAAGGGDPARRGIFTLAQRPAGHQRVHVDMAAQVLRPGVQHEGEGRRAAQPARVGRELGERGSGLVHERVVDPACMRAGQRVELVRQREDEVAVGNGEQLAQARRTPGVAASALALRAVAVAAGVPAPVLGGAAVAAQPLAAECRGAASDDGAPGARLRAAEQVVAQVPGPEAAQHLGQRGGHGRFGGAAAVSAAWAANSAAPGVGGAPHRGRPGGPGEGSASSC